MSQSPNRLSKEKSPYLLQHAHNPVDWFPWGDAAFEKARKDNKPVFLSIGYSTCHWCHVMERESFEDPLIAKFLNDHFVSIKVDREERPDIDGVYMSVVMALTGSGGWPMSVFLTPDKKPFYGGTYFPPEPRWGSPGFMNILIALSEAWKNKREDVLNSSEGIVNSFKTEEGSRRLEEISLGMPVLDRGVHDLLRQCDHEYGGFGIQPKFPMAHNISFLLRQWKRNKDNRLLIMIDRNLSAMASGGIYDHLGGGFHRYSTDQKWHVPHFEKMLYDQATITMAYLESYQATSNQRYAAVAQEVFEYILREMQDKEGGFYCAQDADSVPGDAEGDGFNDAEFSSLDVIPAKAGISIESHSGLDPRLKHAGMTKKEGAYFIWRQSEIEKLLGEKDAEIFNFCFGVYPEGNAENDPHGEFTGQNILFLKHAPQEAATHFKLSAQDIETVLKRSKERLFEIRSKRPKPHLDDKVLTDWNGLMIASLAFGSRILNEPKYVQAAQRSADFILKDLIDSNGRLLHRYRDKEAAIKGMLDDYAFFVHGLIELYETTFEIEYLEHAKRLMQEMVRLFWDDKNGGFYLSACDGEELFYRKKDIYDGAAPSGNAIAALNLIRLSRILGDPDLEKKAQALFDAFAVEINKHPSGYAQMLIALDFALGPSQEIVIIQGQSIDKTGEFLQVLNQHFCPRSVVLIRPYKLSSESDVFKLIPFIKDQISVDGQTTVYVCENHVCKLPLTDLEKFEKLIQGL